MEKEQFISEFSEELIEGNASYFIGSGISGPSKLPDWSGLLASFALSIGIDINNLREKNLPLVAQYIINENIGNRGPLINGISKKLRKKFTPNKYHELISRTNVNSIWTTNYDTLIEDVFGNQIKDVKVNDDSISRNAPDSQIEIIKIHGCIINSKKEEIVITEADYEDFFIKRPAISNRLKMDMIKKSFLFLGYGYGDPNIRNILLEARRLSYSATKQHYMITLTKNKDDIEFKLWCNNLKRVGINVIVIDNPGELQDINVELEDILKKLSLKSRGKSVFITGAHDSIDSPVAMKLGEILATDTEAILLDGQSIGINRTVIQAFMEKCINDKIDILKRLKIFPNPYAANPKFSNDPSHIPTLKQWRLTLFKSAQIVVVFDGGMGTKAEVELAIGLGCFIIPYPQKINGSAHELLQNDIIVKLIKAICPDYIEKAMKMQLNPSDVINLIVSIFNA